MYCHFKTTVKKWKKRMLIANSQCHANPDKMNSSFCDLQNYVFPFVFVAPDSIDLHFLEKWKHSCAPLRVLYGISNSIV